MRNDLVLNYDLRREIILLMTPLRFYIHVFIKLLHSDFTIKCYVRVIQYARAFTPNVQEYISTCGCMGHTARSLGSTSYSKIIYIFHNYFDGSKFRFDVFMSQLFSLKLILTGLYIKLLYNDVLKSAHCKLQILYTTSNIIKLKLIQIYIFRHLQSHETDFCTIRHLPNCNLSTKLTQTNILISIYVNYCPSMIFRKENHTYKSTLKEHFPGSRRIEKSKAKIIPGN